MVAIRVGNRRFTPTLPGTLAALVGIALFARLGLWQLDRAEQKEALQAQLTVGQEQTIDLTADNAASLNRYQRVRVRGRYDAQHQILLDNMVAPSGQPGYRVLTPLQQDNGTWILVDRGWLPWGRTREPLPDVTVPADARAVTGQLDELPRPGMRLDDTAGTTGDVWPRVMNYPRREDIEQVLRHPVQPRIVLLDPAEPDGYGRVRNLTSQFSTGRHLGYAAQWFALALAVLVIFLALSLKKEHRST
jgi:surfeit locus 1 family protein